MAQPLLPRPRARPVYDLKQTVFSASESDGMPPKKGKSLRNSLFDFYQIHKDKGKAYTVHHFAGHGYSRASCYRLIKVFEERQSSEQKVGSGRPRKMSKKDQKRLKKLVNHKTGCSQRK